MTKAKELAELKKNLSSLRTRFVKSRGTLLTSGSRIDRAIDSTKDLECDINFNKEEDLSNNAIDVMGEMGSDADIPLLGAVMLPHLTEHRIRAAQAIALIGGPLAIQYLFWAIEDTTDDKDVRKAALIGLLDIISVCGWEEYKTSVGTLPMPLVMRIRLSRFKNDPWLGKDISEALKAFV